MGVYRRFVLFFLLILSISFTDMGYAKTPQFQSIRAFDYLKNQCAFGPRNPGSEGHKNCLQYLSDKLKVFADTVIVQPFLFSDPKSKKILTLHNIIGRFGNQKERILLCAHWDTRPWADLDSDPKNHQKPILGANDGASGVAVLLEIANLLNESPPPVGVDIVFFDGEDSGINGQDNTWCQGSRYYAQNLGNDLFPSYAILLDFVGDRDLHFPVEGYSRKFVPDLVQAIWERASNLGLSAFDPSLGYYIIDDHLELLKVGIQAVNIIDFEYPYYHTMKDTEDKCSPESLGVVGTLLIDLIYDGP